MGAVTEFKFSAEIGRAFRRQNELKWLKSWGPEWGLLASRYALVFIDNHDNQRGHGSGGSTILTYKQRREYIMATAFMLAHPYGTPRVMSSFDFITSSQGYLNISFLKKLDHKIYIYLNIGPPADENGNILSPRINANNGQCTNGWVCEHRWPEIRRMIKFRNVVGTAPRISWWDNNSNQIAFCRGIRGFIVFNNENKDMNEQLFTCLPSGAYCDIITGQKIDGKCTGSTIDVDENGEAQIKISSSIGVLAIHIEVNNMCFYIE